MGFYIETAEPFDKAGQLMSVASVIMQPSSVDDLPPGQTLLCVVQNGFFDAVAICYDDSELAAFGDPSDARPKTWMCIATSLAAERCPKFDQYLNANV